jgi:hypothetical protein
MCYSTESSYNNWLLTLIGCIIVLLNYNDYLSKWIAIFTLTFSQIQVFEAIAWKNIENNKDDIKFNSKLLYLLYAQPLVNTLFAYNLSHNKFLLYLLFAICSAILYIHIYKVPINIIKGENHHLVWLYNNDPIDPESIIDNKKIMIDSIGLIIYLLGLFIPIFFVNNNKIKYYLLFYFLFTYLYSYINYNKTRELSSYWCFIGTGLIYFYIIIKNI